jgi:hypothetical protein
MLLQITVDDLDFDAAALQELHHVGEILLATGLGSPLQSLEAGDHGLRTRCLRFEAPGYPDTTQDSLPVGG